MLVVSQRDVHVGTNDREDFTSPLPHGTNGELQYGNACQRVVLRVMVLFMARWVCRLTMAESEGRKLKAHGSHPEAPEKKVLAMNTETACIKRICEDIKSFRQSHEGRLPCRGANVSAEEKRLGNTDWNTRTESLCC